MLLVPEWYESTIFSTTGKLCLLILIFIIWCEDTRDFSRERNRTGTQRILTSISFFLPVVLIPPSPFCLFCDCVIPSGIPSDADFSNWKGFLCSRHDSGPFVMTAGRFHFLSLIYQDIMRLGSCPLWYGLPVCLLIVSSHGIATSFRIHVMVPVRTSIELFQDPVIPPFSCALPAT